MADVIRRNRLAGRTIRRALSLTTVGEAVGPITHGCEIYGLTKGQWSLIDLIEYVLGVTGPADIVCSTWTAANADMGFAGKLMRDGRIRSMRFIVDFSFPSRQPAYCAALRERFGDDAIRITKNHAKFVLIRNAEWNIVIRTSMNLNENRRLESFEVSDDAALAGYLQDVVDDLFRDQTAAQTFGRKPAEHVKAFESQWGESVKPGSVVVSTDTKKFFGDGPMENDMRRAGISYI